MGFFLQSGYSPNYLSEIQRASYPVLYNTQNSIFRNVLILPGEKAHFLCTDGALWTDVPAALP